MVPLVLSFFLLSSVAVCAENASLYDTFSRRATVKVFLTTPTDLSEKKALDLHALKQTLERTFQARKSIHFQIVPTEAEAELLVDTEVQGFLFSETDPVDMLVGAGAVAMDAAIQDHFASTEALFTVRDAKSQTVLWKDKVKASVTDHTMTEPESRGLVTEKLGEMLMRQAFGKKKK